MLKIFAIFDKKALSYSQPCYFHNKSLALRAFSELVNDQKSDPSKYPADFSIWMLGEWDPQQGVITPFNKPEFVEEASNCVQKGV